MKEMNKLSKERSLYLQQHADNPVDWYPWCDEAFEIAKKTNKPIMLSIGYSACHWCHVMAHESFEDQETADILNTHFINIKVDREERPDVDKVYQMSQSIITGKNGGWPLTIYSWIMINFHFLVARISRKKTSMECYHLKKF